MFNHQGVSINSGSILARVYDDSFNMDGEIEWISDASDYESGQDTPSLQNGNSQII